MAYTDILKEIEAALGGAEELETDFVTSKDAMAKADSLERVREAKTETQITTAVQRAIADQQRKDFESTREQQRKDAESAARVGRGG